MDERDRWAQLYRLEAEVAELRRELGLPTERIGLGLSSRERLLLAAEQVAHIGSWTWNPATDEVAWSDEMFRILGLDRQVTPPSVEAFFTRVHPDDLARAEQTMADLLRTGSTSSMRLRIVRPSGELRELRLETTFVDSPGAVRSHQVGTVVDETDTRRAENLTAQMVAGLSEAERLAGVGSWWWRRSDSAQQWSTGMYRLLGLDDGTLPTDELFYRHVHPDDLESMRAAAAQSVTTGIPTQLDLRMVRSDGAVRDMVLVSRAMFDESGALHGFHGVLMDITERKALESTARHAQKMEAVGTLAGGVAHDFNNYLLVIGGHADLVAGGLPEGHAAHASLAAIRFAHDRCVHLTEQLLTLSRRRPTRARRFDLGRRIDELAPMLRSVLGETVRLQLQLERANAHVLADPAHVEHVLMNLALNARDAMPGGGTLTMQLESTVLAEHQVPELAAGPYVELTVRDTGCGIERATLSRIFEPFFTTKAPGKGTGLGLAMVYGTMRDAGGGLTVESQIGRGTTFHLYFRPDGEDATRGRHGEGPRRAVARGLRLLLAEDLEHLRDLLAAQLEHAGYVVCTAADGVEALTMLKDGPVDVLLSDVVMPNMGGIELVRAARALHPELPCLLMSGYAASLLSGAQLDPPVPVLSKPFNERDLREALAALIGGSASER